MAADNFVYPKLKVFQLNSTQVAAGAKIYTYEAGTTTNKTTYSDQALTTANANPVIADSNGEATIWLMDDGLYKIVINDSSDVLICSFDNVGPYESTATSVTGKYNLVLNGSFETNNGDNGTPDNWTLSITSGSIQIDQANQTHGLSCLEFTDGGSGAGSATTDFFPVEAGSQIVSRFSMKASTATTGNKVQILWYDKDQNAASTASTDILDITAAVPTSWTEYVLTATAGSDAVYAKFRIFGSTTAGISYYDNVVVKQDEIPFRKGAAIDSATALTLGNDGNYFDVTGTTTITSISSRPIGTVIKLHFNAALTLTHHATDLVLPTETNITTAAGDEAEFYCYATGDWRCTNYSAIIDGSVTTAKIADGAVTGVKLADAVTGNYLICEQVTDANVNPAASFAKVLEYKVARAGTFNVRMGQRGNGVNESGNFSWRIYVDGVATGTTRTRGTPTATWIYHNEDITVTAGQLIQVYAYDTADDSDTASFYLALLTDTIIDGAGALYTLAEERAN